MKIMKFFLRKFCCNYFWYAAQGEMKSLYHYFKSNSPLPSPNGPLSREVPAIAISKANKEVTKVLKDSEGKDGVKSRGTYQKYTSKDKVMIGNYAVMHGTSAAPRHFNNKFPDLKYTTVCEWRKVIVTKPQKEEKGQRCSLMMFLPSL